MNLAEARTFFDDWNAQDQMKLIPNGNKILMLPIDESSDSTSTLIIPDLGKEKTYMGLVIASGEGFKSILNGALIPNTCQPGDVVYYPKFNCVEVEVGNNKFHCSKDDEIFIIRK